MRNYKVPDFFNNYIISSGKHKNSPEGWLKEHVIDNLSNKVTTIVDFGCAVGRNFIPFTTENTHNSYKFIGFDIHLEEHLHVNKLVDFLYYKYSLEDFLKDINSFNIKWEECLVFSHGTLMYFKHPSESNDFINILRNKGCKNFVLHEYASKIAQENLSERALNGGLGYIDLNEDNLKLFTPPFGKKINFEEPQNDLQVHIHLEKK